MKSAKPKTVIQILTEYFGKQPDQKVADFSAELKRLSKAEQTELARMAATDLGYSEDQLAF